MLDLGIGLGLVLAGFDTALARLFLIAVAKPPSGDITSWA
jgi:hypothetical protein